MTPAEKLVEAVAREQFAAWVKALCPGWDFPFDGPSPLTSNGMTFREYHELQARSALSTIDAAGWAVVPKVPTEEMRRAFQVQYDIWIREEGTDDDLYTAMLAAAPKVVP